ncbi:MAG: serine hydrolase [Blastocatellia bacterium]|nr:serine hydrolase [Blastocatellia bacterium]
MLKSYCKTHLVILAFLAITLALNISAQDTNAKFDEYLTALTKQDRFMGSVLVARDGKVVFSKGYGMANLEFDIPNTPQTKFRLGSVTKQFGAASILLLQERGKLSVQDPICKYVENCPKTWEPITVHHLLSHTSGIPNFTNFPEYPKTMMIPATMDSLLARFKDKPLDFQPLEKWNYSNSGYVLLGHIIEKASGESFESFLQKNILTPLKMQNSGYDLHRKILKNRATGYSPSGNGKANSEIIDMTIPHAAGAMYSTVEDLFLWNEALFGDKLLSAKSREAMTTVVKNNYGYGLTIDKMHNRQAVSHGGGINGFNTYLARFPEEKVTVVVLRNVDGGAPGPGKISADLAAILFGEKYDIPTVKTVAKVDPKIYDAYVGEYQLAPNFILTVRRNGDRLMTQATGQGEIEIFPESETKFFPKVMEASLTFVKDESGKVTHLILNQGGERKAMKIK